MTPPALIILGPRCQNCDASIPVSIAHALGDDFAGYLCFNCKAWRSEQTARLLAENQQAAKPDEINSSEIATPCAMCGKRSRRMMLVGIDGRMGFVCANTPLTPTDCERKWVEKNRSKIGPAAQFKLKLK